MSSFKRLSPEEMDSHRDKAALALKSISSEAVKTVTDWWKQWYLTAGHKRLGRLLIAHGQNKGQKPDIKQDNSVSEIRACTILSGVRYTFTKAPQDTAAMFSVHYQGGEVRIVLNTLHPAYLYLRGILDHSDALQLDDTHQNTDSSIIGIKLLLAAWSRYECDQPQGILHTRARDVRFDWGRVGREQLYQWKSEMG